MSEKGEVLLRGVGTLRYLLILSKNSPCQVPICAVAAWWFDNPHQKVVPRSWIPRSTSHFSYQGGPEEWGSLVTIGLIAFYSWIFTIFEPSCWPNVQTPFLGTPLIPLKVLGTTQVTLTHSVVCCVVCMWWLISLSDSSGLITTRVKVRVGCSAWSLFIVTVLRQGDYIAKLAPSKRQGTTSLGCLASSGKKSTISLRRAVGHDLKPQLQTSLWSREFCEPGLSYSSAQFLRKVLWRIAETAIFPSFKYKDEPVIIAEICWDDESTRKLRRKVSESWLLKLPYHIHSRVGPWDDLCSGGLGSSQRERNMIFIWIRGPTHQSRFKCTCTWVWFRWTYLLKHLLNQCFSLLTHILLGTNPMTHNKLRLH